MANQRLEYSSISSLELNIQPIAKDRIFQDSNLDLEHVLTITLNIHWACAYRMCLYPTQLTCNMLYQYAMHDLVYSGRVKS